MAIHDYDNTAFHEIGKVHDYDGTAFHEIGKVHDYDGTAFHEIWSAEQTIFTKENGPIGWSSSDCTSNTYYGSISVQSWSATNWMIRCEIKSSGTSMYATMTLPNLGAITGLYYEGEIGGTSNHSPTLDVYVKDSNKQRIGTKQTINWGTWTTLNTPVPSNGFIEIGLSRFNVAATSNWIRKLVIR